MTPGVPRVFAHWETFVEWLLGRTEKFPKRVAMTFRTRLDNLALEVVERLVEARFSKDKMPLLVQINLALEKMRLLLRLSFKQRLLDEKAFLFACEQIDVAGRMSPVLRLQVHLGTEAPWPGGDPRVVAGPPFFQEDA